MKNQLLFVISCVILSLGIYIIPAFIVNPNFNFYNSTEVQVCIVQAVFLLVSQGSIDTKAIKKSVKTDKWSTYFILLVGVLSQILSIIEYTINGLNVERSGFLQFLFLGLALTGNQIRIAAILKLENNFTASIDKIEYRKLVDTWLFAYIRHPSYLGAILFLLGNSLYLGSYVSFYISLVLFIVVYNNRIGLEEQQLEIYFGKEYVGYKRRTWRLIPFIW